MVTLNNKQLRYVTSSNPQPGSILQARGSSVRLRARDRNIACNFQHSLSLCPMDGKDGFKRRSEAIFGALDTGTTDQRGSWALAEHQVLNFILIWLDRGSIEQLIDSFTWNYSPMIPHTLVRMPIGLYVRLCLRCLKAGKMLATAVMRIEKLSNGNQKFLPAFSLTVRYTVI